MVEREGGRIVFSAEVISLVIGTVDEMWDVAALVEYPSSSAFARIVTSPEVATIGVHRSAGLAGQYDPRRAAAEKRNKAHADSFGSSSAGRRTRHPLATRFFQSPAARPQLGVRRSANSASRQCGDFGGLLWRLRYPCAWRLRSEFRDTSHGAAACDRHRADRTHHQLPIDGGGTPVLQPMLVELTLLIVFGVGRAMLARN